MAGTMSKRIAAALSLGLAFGGLCRAAEPAPPPAPSPRFFEAHREKFLARLPAGSIAVFHARPDMPNDTRADAYRQDEDFWYLTGLAEPNAVAVLVGGAPKESRYLLFVQPKEFSAEQWTGWRVGLDGAKKDYGAAQSYVYGEFWSRFVQLSSSAEALYYTTGGDKEFGRRLLEVWNANNGNIPAPRPSAEAGPALAAMRLVKDPEEIALVREASRLSAEAHRAAMAEVGPGRHEYDLKAAMVSLCLRGGAARMAYPPIVASGPNSVILHHERDDRRLENGDVIVNDTACEYGMYAADVTRTYPVSGTFSPEQREIYDIVLAAQKAGFAAVKPGAAFHEVHDAAVSVVVDGLLKLGILTGRREDVPRTHGYQKFFPHGTSHWLGLNVHDAGSYAYPMGAGRLERYGAAQTKLEPGMILTVEPGIYITERATADPRWWNIGVRVEDDVLVTPSGMECLSCSAPREREEVEKAVREGQARREKAEKASR
jgi:Xaa-Pro aminopeptidase